MQAHLAEVYGADVSRQTISTITDKVLEGMAEWQNRPLDPVYPVVFIDAIHVKIRDGAVANRPIYVALAVTVEGRREILGLWAGDGGEGAKHWMHILTEIKNRGAGDVLMLVCDGLKGLPDAVETVWPKTIVQTCVVHLLRNSFRYAARQDWDKIAKLLKPVYTAPTEEAALERFAEFADTWGRKYPAIVRLWENAWEEFTPFLRFDTEIRRIVCTTNAIESVNARIRRAVKARGHFPNETAALNHIAHERAFGRHVGSDRLIQVGLEALIAGVESPSLAMLAGLLRSEEPEAPALFDQVLEELELLFQPPTDPRAAKWSMAYWIAGRIVAGSLDPATGTHLIWADVAYDLNYPEDLQPLVSCALNLDDWDESWGVSVEALKEEAIKAAEQLLSKQPLGERKD